jgi:aminoglycoside phosphotransferase (APT) family kinase protein
MTAAHGDYRADNLFFGNPGSGYDVAVIDWQSPNKGWGSV